MTTHSKKNPLWLRNRRKEMTNGVKWKTLPSVSWHCNVLINVSVKASPPEAVNTGNSEDRRSCQHQACCWFDYYKRSLEYYELCVKPRGTTWNSSKGCRRKGSQKVCLQLMFKSFNICINCSKEFKTDLLKNIPLISGIGIRYFFVLCQIFV
jgi:hypothetical protein